MTEYIELHCHSHYSLLDGASSPKELVQAAQALGMNTLALTDHDNVYGAVEFAQVAKEAGIRPVFGAELTLESGHHLTLLVRNRIGWANLNALISLAQYNAPKGEALLPVEALAAHTEGLIALSGCRRGAVSTALLARNYKDAERIACTYRDLFGRDYFWIELQRHLTPQDDWLVELETRLAKKLGVGYIATNNVHYAHREEQQLQDVMTCIRHLTQLDDAAGLLRPNDEYHIKRTDEMLRLFRTTPEAIEHTRWVADLCDFDLTQLSYQLPDFPLSKGHSAGSYLRELCLTSPRNTSLTLMRQMDYELKVIRQSGLEDYFLIVWDIVRYARENGIRCQGRGSAANSVVAYLLYITAINPLDHDLVFERFLSAERQVIPDIDVDFDAARREEVIQYVYDRYGQHHAAMACTFSTFRARSAVRDVGKVLGLAPRMVDVLAKSLDRFDLEGLQAPDSPIGRQLLDLCQQINRRPRHLSIHNGGMVIAKSLMTDVVATEPATMPGRTVVQWDKEGLEDAGIPKIDILGLRMLSAMDEAAKLAGVDLDDLSFDDPAVYDMICQADTIGVFQVESRAQMQVLPRLKPRCFADLVVSISLIRPGPIQGNMVHPYLRRRLGEEEVDYYHPLLKETLKETLGVILFQEQVLKVARDLAGFSPGQGEMLRRSLGKKDAVAALQSFEDDFIQGALKRGVDEPTARLVFARLLGFGSYSFPKSHAASFAVLVYQSAWLRRYHPVPFYIALLNNQPMGFYSPSVIVNDARRHRVKVYPVHLNLSQGECTLEVDGFRLSFEYVKGMGEAAAQQIIEARGNGIFEELDDFCSRTRLPMRLVENLIQAGAMDMWGISRRQLIWQLGFIHYQEDDLGLDFEFDGAELPILSDFDALTMEYETMGLSAQHHIMEFYREWLDERGICTSEQVATTPAGTGIQVAGWMVVRQAPPTAKGFQFITLEDEFGAINVIVNPQVYQKYRRVLRQYALFIIGGVVQRQQHVVNVVASTVQAIPIVSSR